ncbi:hypothetical protein Mapa_007549 [Marchantia paleacea]|nr:hypothetical protein Mapa_007549 [Marchantia paleacea]
MMGEDGNAFPGLNMFDLVGDKILDKKGNPIPGRFQFNEDGNVFLDAEGYPFLERQETTEEKQARLALEEQRRKAKAFREKLEAQRVMMSTPLPRKSVKWNKYCNTYFPSSLKTAILRDRGKPGDDWRNFVKTYTIDQMNHRMARHLHGRAGILWDRLHTHITYLQNPRYASENPKHIKVIINPPAGRAAL